ncbi:hypothetical protein J7384_09810 [Endozoicomonas sp. G2_1]|uniref:hypothetical protein n=1 Tax=Endozoicomonas sp. G2_1 TaxID=2821091 RepID=UPI001AD9E17E|nr:hypothetical protein [Endozoicomonas sp. G2_1]MBO9490658.1 hypothetical protein [Endozoicomonas sp. G2_1]
MNKLIVTDVFGHNSALENLINSLDGDIDVVSPYTTEQSFDDDNDAYQYFTKHLGFEGYCQMLSHKLKSYRGESVSILGFSVGAAALWWFAGQEVSKNLSITGGLGFYGNQIRHFTELTPNFPMTLIVPKFEPHFSVNQLKTDLAGKAQLTVESCDYLHGFINSKSVNFNQTGYQAYLNRLALLSRDQCFSESSTVVE